MFLAAIAWVLLVWPDPTTCQVIYVRFPEAVSHRESHEVMKSCWDLRDEFEALGAMAVCDHAGLKVIHIHLRNGRQYLFSGGPRSTVGIASPVQAGDKLCIWKPY